MTFISEIAKVTHTSEQTIRVIMQQGCEWGTAVKRPGSRVYTYIPYPEKIKELFGIENDSSLTDRNGD